MENWWRVRHQHQYLKMTSRPRLKEKQELMRCPQESVSNNSLSIWLVFGVILLILFHSTHSTVVACLSNHPSIYLSICLSVCLSFTPYTVHRLITHPCMWLSAVSVCMSVYLSPSVSICTHFALMKIQHSKCQPNNYLVFDIQWIHLSTVLVSTPMQINTITYSD